MSRNLIDRILVLATKDPQFFEDFCRNPAVVLQQQGYQASGEDIALFQELEQKNVDQVRQYLFDKLDPFNTWK